LAREQVSLETAKEDAKKVIVAGDIVTPTPTGTCGDAYKKGHFYVVKRNGPVYIETVVDSRGSTTNGLGHQYFRLATKEETKRYLIEEAAEHGIIVGSQVSPPASLSFKIARFVLLEKDKDYGDNYSGNTFDYLAEKTTPRYTLVAESNMCDHPVPLLIEQLKTGVSVKTTGGNVYQAVFHSDHVQFGCASISNYMLRQIVALNADARTINCREFTSVTIGRGIFDIDTVSKLTCHPYFGKEQPCV